MSAKDDTGRESTEALFLNTLIRRFKDYASWSNLTADTKSNFSVGMKSVYDRLLSRGEEGQTDNSSKDVKSQIIIDFLELAGLTSSDYQLADNTNLDDLIKDIKFILKTIVNDLGATASSFDEEGDVLNDVITIQKILTLDLNTKVSSLIEKVFRESNYSREKMLVTTDGKKVMRDILGTHLDKVIKQLRNLYINEYYVVEPYMKTAMFSLNSFVNKNLLYANKIYNIYTYDGHRNENTGLVKVRKNENKAEYWRREFVGYFIDALGNSSKDTPTYMQSFFDLEGREKMKKVQINVLSRNQTEEGLKGIIAQIKSYNKGLSAYNGDSSKRFVNFQFKDEAGNDVFNDADFDSMSEPQIMQIVKKALAQQVQDITNQLVEEQTLFDSELFNKLAKLQGNPNT
jgi:hypothetical protein